MYRIRSLEHKPLIIADAVIAEYGENKVETLHVKVSVDCAVVSVPTLTPLCRQNLLSLGEDRYLTTLMLKVSPISPLSRAQLLISTFPQRFPDYKMKFCPDAHAKTIAPDDWRVLMSQRRRWINSTIHNLMELVFIDRLCGFCCFSMRFIVFIGEAHTSVGGQAFADSFSASRSALNCHLTGHRRLHCLRMSFRGLIPPLPLADASPHSSSTRLPARVKRFPPSVSSDAIDELLAQLNPSSRQPSLCLEQFTDARSSSTSYIAVSSTSVSSLGDSQLSKAR